MPQPIAQQSKIANVQVTIPKGMQQFVKQLTLDNQELRNAVISLQSQVNDLTRRTG